MRNSEITPSWSWENALFAALLMLFVVSILVVSASAEVTSKFPLEFGGQVRLRGETTNVQSYVPATPHLKRGDDFGLLRTRIDVTAQPAKGVKAFAQIQDARTWGTEASVAANSANVDLHQGYIKVADLWDLPLSITGGRMELEYGSQRLVSPLDWSNTGRAWDGVKLSAGDKLWSADLFSTVVVENALARRDQYFSGLYMTCKAVERHEMDLYILSRDFNNGTQTAENGTTGNMAEKTVGSRFQGKTGGFDYETEVAWQFGRIAGQRKRAFASALLAGYTFDAGWEPRIGAGYDFATGDSDPADNEVQTFHPLFPFGHYYQGHQDQFGWRNGHSLKGQFSAKPAEGWKAMLDFHNFSMHHSRDSWYGAGATAIATDATGSSSKDVGSEIDIHFKTSVREVVKLWFGYSHFWTGRFVRNTSSVRDRDWAFFQAALNF